MSAPSVTTDEPSICDDLAGCEQELDAHIDAMLEQAGVPASAEQRAVWRAVVARDSQWRRVVAGSSSFEPRPLLVFLDRVGWPPPAPQPTLERTKREHRAACFSSWLGRLEQVIVERLEDPNSRISQALSRNLVGRGQQ